MDLNHRAFYGRDLQSRAINHSATPPICLHTPAMPWSPAIQSRSKENVY
jgi:hypothetical protein